jgi:hypothetical protein
MVKKILKDLSKAPAPKQLAVGAGAGWLVGYLTMKVGKAAATAVGGSLLLLQVTVYQKFKIEDLIERGLGENVHELGPKIGG